MAKPPILRPEPTRAAVRRFIAEQVREGSLRPGDKLSPAALASELGVSATPMREALIELVRDGYLDNRAQYGFTVRPLTVKEVRELYPLIASLEVLAMRSQTFTPESLDELDRINSLFIKASKPAEVSALDSMWHSNLVANSDSETLHEMIDMLKARVQRYEEAYIRYSGALPASARQHRAITRALRGGQIGPAEKTLEENWLAGIRFLVPWLESQSHNQ
ncbi:MAG TPA: GntR family transcriptional regulator [Gemmatimonadaceae bacterium]|jgi:DNA-binding GntR family transcriptional regulator